MTIPEDLRSSTAYQIQLLRGSGNSLVTSTSSEFTIFARPRPPKGPRPVDVSSPPEEVSTVPPSPPPRLPPKPPMSADSPQLRSLAQKLDIPTSSLGKVSASSPAGSPPESPRSVSSQRISPDSLHLLSREPSISQTGPSSTASSQEDSGPTVTAATPMSPTTAGRRALAGLPFRMGGRGVFGRGGGGGSGSPELHLTPAELAAVRQL